MTLSEYLTQQKMSQRQIAGALGVHPAQVTRWTKGTLLPSLEMVARIEAATGGQVRADDWMAALRPPSSDQAA